MSVILKNLNIFFESFNIEVHGGVFKSINVCTVSLLKDAYFFLDASELNSFLNQYN